MRNTRIDRNLDNLDNLDNLENRTIYCVVPAVIEAVGKDCDYGSFISFGQEINHQELDDEIVRLIRHNIETLGISPHEICVVGPQRVPQAAITRRLVAALPEYNLRPRHGAVFSRPRQYLVQDISARIDPARATNVRSKDALAGEVLEHFRSVGIDTSKTSRRDLLRYCNPIEILVDDGLEYLELFFDELLLALGIDISLFSSLGDHRTAFFERLRIQIERLENAGVQAVSSIAMFRRLFATRSGICAARRRGSAFRGS